MTAAPALPRFTELQAAPSWQAVEFISDLHLQAEEPATCTAWRRYMEGTRADALFILGDLFEVWVGDDAARGPGFTAECAQVIHATAQRLPVFFMHGNRDFLVGPDMMALSGATLLPDPTVLGFGERRWLLTHGDLLCTDDEPYMQFRAQVRSPAWQRDFLGKPLAERAAIGRQLRLQSEERKRAAGGVEYAHVDDALAREWLSEADATVMVHGHTHRPAGHDLGGGLRRIVLSDWDAAASPPRLQVLRLTAGGTERLSLA